MNKPKNIKSNIPSAPRLVAGIEKSIELSDKSLEEYRANTKSTDPNAHAKIQSIEQLQLLLKKSLMCAKSL